MPQRQYSKPDLIHAHRTVLQVTRKTSFGCIIFYPQGNFPGNLTHPCSQQQTSGRQHPQEHRAEDSNKVNACMSRSGTDCLRREILLAMSALCLQGCSAQHQPMLPESDVIRVLQCPQPTEGIAHSREHDLSAPHALPGFSVRKAGPTNPLPGQPPGPAGHLPPWLRLLAQHVAPAQRQLGRAVRRSRGEPAPQVAGGLKQVRQPAGSRVC